MRLSKCQLAVLLMAVVARGAGAFGFESLFSDKFKCGAHAEACDCSADRPSDCTVEELTTLCMGCMGDLTIGEGFKGRSPPDYFNSLRLFFANQLMETAPRRSAWLRYMTM